MLELTAALTQTEDEYEALKVYHQVLENKYEQLQKEIAKQSHTEESEKAELLKLRLEVKENVNSGQRHEGNETKLKDIISKQQNEMKEQEAKFTEATNPGFDAFIWDHLVEHMVSKILFADSQHGFVPNRGLSNLLLALEE